MTKEDFLRQIRISLSGKVSPEVIDESVRYYDDYIMMQVRKGQTEAEVLESLGDPRLLAKSIAAAKGQTSENIGRNHADESEEFTSGKPKSWENLKREFGNMPKWLRILLMIGFAIIVLVLIVVFFGVILAALPFVLILIGLMFAVNYIRKHFRL